MNINDRSNSPVGKRVVIVSEVDASPPVIAPSGGQESTVDAIGIVGVPELSNISKSVESTDSNIKPTDAPAEFKSSTSEETHFITKPSADISALDKYSDNEKYDNGIVNNSNVAEPIVRIQSSEENVSAVLGQVNLPGANTKTTNVKSSEESGFVETQIITQPVIRSVSKDDSFDGVRTISTNINNPTIKVIANDTLPQIIMPDVSMPKVEVIAKNMDNILRGNNSIGDISDTIFNSTKNLPSADEKLQRYDSLLNGSWIPDFNPLVIGINNFSTLENFRYRDYGIEGVGGYTNINSTALTYHINNAFQLVTNYTTYSYIIAQCIGDHNYLYINKYTPPATGDFFATPIFAETAGASLGRFSNFPQGQMGYCNSKDTLIWPGEEGPIAAFLSGQGTTAYPVISDIALAGDVTMATSLGYYVLSDLISDKTDYVTSTSGNTLSLESVRPTYRYYLIGTTKPVTGFNFDITAESKPFTIDTSNNTFNIHDSGGVLRTGILTSGTYTGDELAAEVATQLTTYISGGAFGETTGKFTFTSAGGDIHYLHAGSTAGPTMGFWADTTAAATIVSPVAARATYMYEWNGSVFKKFLSKTDGTLSNYSSLMANGSITWTATGLAKTLYTSGYSLYFYLMILTHGSPVINKITATYPCQSVQNIWDGVRRKPIGFLYNEAGGGFTTVESTSDVLVVSIYGPVSSPSLDKNSVDIDITGATGPEAVAAIEAALQSSFSVDFKVSYGADGKFGIGCDGYITTVYCAADEPTSTAATIFGYETTVTKNSYSNWCYSSKQVWGSSPVISIKDYTLEVQDKSFVGNPIDCDLYTLNAAGTENDSIFMVFTDPIEYIFFDFSSISTVDAEIASTDISINYYNGDNWIPADIIYDTTSSKNTAKSFRRSGGMYFSIGSGVEHKTTINDIIGYAYEFKWSGGTGIKFKNGQKLDMVYGIVRGAKITDAYVFPFTFQNRAMLCGNITQNQKNAIYYSKSYSPDVWNGEDSSALGKELLVGDDDALTGAIEVLDRTSDAIISTALLFKATETYLLTGYSPETFQLYKVSPSIGCPAPLTIVSAEVFRDKNNGTAVNTILWMSDKGVHAYIGGSLFLIKGIDKYFDPNQSDYCINYSAITMSRAWYDAQYQEYNLVIPTKESSTPNVWLVYDINRNKWYQKTPPIPLMPFGGLSVVGTNGIKYSYGYNNWTYAITSSSLNASRVIRLENGVTWAGTYIQYKIATSDIQFNEHWWDIAQLNKFKLLYKPDDTAMLTMNLYRDGSDYPSQSFNTLINDTTHYGKKLSFISDAAYTYMVEFILNYATEKPSIYAFGMQFSVYGEDDTVDFALTTGYEDTLIAKAGATLTAGDFVTFSNSDYPTVVKAYAKASYNYTAVGYVTQAYSVGDSVVVYLTGVNPCAVTASGNLITPGVIYYLADEGHAGKITSTKPTTQDDIIQMIGSGVSSASVSFSNNYIRLVP